MTIESGLQISNGPPNWDGRYAVVPIKDPEVECQFATFRGVILKSSPSDSSVTT